VAGALPLEHRPLHLGPGGTASVLPAFTGPQWYEDYAAAHGADGVQGRLVSLHHFTADWPGWEMHPHGAEVVICVAGEATLVQQEQDGAYHRIALAPGDHAINPPGTWHTADVAHAASLIFITVGMATQTRPR
jgi:mannose-6-phosphate isomerase-like protein (cupin superfamily)